MYSFLRESLPKETKVCVSFIFTLDTSFSGCNISTQIEEIQTGIEAKTEGMFYDNQSKRDLYLTGQEVLRFRMGFH